MTRIMMLGLTTVDVVHVHTDAVRPNEKVRAEHQFLAAGGPAANAAVLAAALGFETHLVTALGVHPLAQLVRADLQDHGVRLHDVAADASGPPPLSLVRLATASAERSVSSLNDGALAEHCVPTRDPALATLLLGADAVLIDGYYPELLDAYHAQLAGHDHLVIDLGSWKESYAPLLAHAAIVAASADATLPEGGDLLLALMERGARVAVQTAGADPVRAAWREGEPNGPLARQAPRDGARALHRESVPVPQVEARDTLGAGDVFHGALTASLAARPHDPLTSHLTFAARLAALRCRHLGPRTYLAHVPSARGGAAPTSHPS
ncbi:MAG: PfkB family carbohydrate kinase [Bowdeniella nasicola]|nr:PfkB family carbohydrate kinase [Bowdeniella nasicola]